MKSFSFFIYEKETIFHRMDPRAKFIWLLCIILWVFIFSNPMWLVILLSSEVLFLRLEGIFSYLRFRMGELVKLFISIVILLILIPNGRVEIIVLGLPFLRGTVLRIYYEEFIFALIVALRTTIIIFSIMLFLSVTKIEDLEITLMRIGIPLVVVNLVTIGFRLFQEFYSEVKRVSLINKSYSDKGHFDFLRVRRHFIMLITLLKWIVVRWHEINMAIRNREERFRRRRRFLYPIKAEFKDTILILAAVGFTLLFLLIHIYGYKFIMQVFIINW
ncbi:MAG: hypothetical protein J7L07_05045 [Candidatus Odinarchaeota archaeon]|nr:hypothetical protein [Candidatus Odinarchaeota archaeon]